MPNLQSPMTLLFKPIDLQTHLNTCIAFEQDACLVNFGSEQRCQAEAGEHNEHYTIWLRRYATAFPDGLIHVWQDNIIIGQLIFRLLENGSGYVNSFYLAPNQRGIGLGAQLHTYLVDNFKTRDCHYVRLRISASNQAALKFFQKHHWQFVQVDPVDSLMHIYALEF